MPPTYLFDARNVRDGGTDVQGGQSLTQEWECVVDDHMVDAGDVIDALADIVGVVRGGPHPTYGYALCQNVTAVVEPQDAFRWIVKATFLEPRPQPGAPVNPEGGQPSPENREPWVRGSMRREDVFRGYDRNNLAFVNSVGDIFDNPPPIPLGVGQLVIVKYFPTISYFDLLAYQNCTNDDDFFDFPPHSLCIMAIEWAPHSERGWSGFKTTWTLEHREATPEQDAIPGAPAATGGFHPIPVADMGWYQMVDVGTEEEPDLERRIYDDPPDSGVPKTVPGFLNGIDGQRSAVPCYIGFDLHARISFAILEP